MLPYYLPLVLSEIDHRVTQAGVGLIKAVSCSQHDLGMDQRPPTEMFATAIPQGGYIGEPGGGMDG